jgi:hypothetical protein
VKKVPSFVYGHVLGALVTGAVAGSFLDWQAVTSFAGVLAVNAVIGALICWWWPGFDAAGWKLWLVATFANPLILAAIGFSIDQFDCLVGRQTGWNCMFSDVGPLAAAACLPSPLIGLAVRWLWRRRRAAV